MLKFLQFILRLLSKAVIKKYKPLVIGITGSVGKTSTKEAIFAVLKKSFGEKIRASDANFNNEIGFPMAILRLKKPGKFIWFINLLKALKLLLIKDKNYPQILVLEMGADKPKDIDYLLSIAKPKIGVITEIGEIPVHIEFYSDQKEIAKEKSKLIKALPKDGLAILNYDDPLIYEMKEETKAKVLTFGFNENAEIFASDINYFIETRNEAITSGISFKVNHNQRVIPFRLNNALGKHQIYPILPAVILGLYFGMNFIEIAQALENFEFPKQRMHLYPGIKNTWIIDDSYNASPLSMKAALETLRDFGDKIIQKQGFGRKIAFLGDMAELGIFTENAHRKIGNLAGEIVDYLFTVGIKAKFIADSAFNQMPKENIISFENSKEAGEFLKEFIKEGDIVLVKGSRIMKMEEIIKNLSST